MSATPTDGTSTADPPRLAVGVPVPVLERPMAVSEPCRAWRSSRSAAMLLGRGRPHALPKLVLASLVALVVLWGGWLPEQLGGRMSYVITDGTSMLPRYHAGDFVVTRSEPSYHVGEVAAFHNQQLGVIVLHRIVAIHGNRYVFKGDNNSWVTSYEPTKSQIVGAEWLHLPGAGRLVLDLRHPAVAACLLASVWLFSFSPAARSRRQRRRHRRGH